MSAGRPGFVEPADRDPWESRADAVYRDCDGDKMMLTVERRVGGPPILCVTGVRVEEGVSVHVYVEVDDLPELISQLMELTVQARGVRAGQVPAL